MSGIFITIWSTHGHLGQNQNGRTFEIQGLARFCFTEQDNYITLTNNNSGGLLLGSWKTHLRSNCRNFPGHASAIRILQNFCQLVFTRFLDQFYFSIICQKICEIGNVIFPKLNLPQHLIHSRDVENI